MAPRKKTLIRRGPGRPRNPLPDEAPRRGRPPKIAAASTPAKRRGRPPKDAAAGKPVKKAFPLVARGDLMRLLEQAAILKNRAASINGQRSEMIGEYVQKKHLHAAAFRIVSRWLKMGEDDPEKLWLELAHVDDMRLKAGIDRLAQKQGQLLPAIADQGEDKGEPDEPASEHEPERDERNIVDLPPPRQVEERAGDAA